jgi:hypothetical protein
MFNFGFFTVRTFHHDLSGLGHRLATDQSEQDRQDHYYRAASRVQQDKDQREQQPAGH